VTRISPTRVSVDGGTLVTVTGVSLEPGVSVRVGPSRTARVVSATATSVRFYAPAAVVGTYDVTVHKNGRSSVLNGALTYVDGSSGGDDRAGTTPQPSAPQPATPTPTPSPSPPAPGTPVPTPGTPVPSGPGTTPAAPKVERVGPNGERLVRNEALASLTGLWSVRCSTSCEGVQV
jgi:hypothetical protein